MRLINNEVNQFRKLERIERKKELMQKKGEIRTQRKEQRKEKLITIKRKARIKMASWFGIIKKRVGKKRKARTSSANIDYSLALKWALGERKIIHKKEPEKIIYPFQDFEVKSEIRPKPLIREITSLKSTVLLESDDPLEADIKSLKNHGFRVKKVWKACL